MHPWIRYIILKSGGKGFTTWEQFEDYLLGSEKLLGPWYWEDYR
jgi:hypothetical protein